MTEREVVTLEGFRAGYVEVAGLPSWHEVRGEGPPSSGSTQQSLSGE